MRAIGIDIGGTKLIGAVVDEAGEVHQRERVPSGTSAAEILGQLAALIQRLDPDHQCEAIGVSVAGFLDYDSSVMRYSPNLPLVEVPLRQELTRRTGRPSIVIENDAAAATWGEYRFGVGRIHDAQDALMVALGTGVGGGLIINGQLYRGAHGMSGEFGHMTVQPEGRLCGCQRRGCLEQYASGNALGRYGREAVQGEPERGHTMLALAQGEISRINGEVVTVAARKGDPLALAALEELAQWLGRAIADQIAVFDPDLIMIGGGLSAEGELVVEPIRRATMQRVAVAQFRDLPHLLPASLGNDAGVVGAADLGRLAL